MTPDARLDVAIIGAGAAGTLLANKLAAAQPAWTVGLFERRERTGGRLRSVIVPGIRHPIELGGMRYLTSHATVQRVVTELGLETRPFDVLGAPEHSFLRGRLGGGPGDPDAGKGYALTDGERGRAAGDLALDAFESIVPGAANLTPDAWATARRTGSYGGRPLRDWSLAEALATVRSAEGHRFVTDAFGYDSGVRPHNAADAIPYLLGGGDPSAEARVPIGGMDRIPSELAERFRARGGAIHMGRDLHSITIDGGDVVLAFGDGEPVRARRLVLTMPVPALAAVAAESPAMRGPGWRVLFGAVEGFPATKLYCWYERPWWRDGPTAPRGIRTTTDLPIRKVFYFDDGAQGPAAILASYTDGRETGPIVDLADGRSDGAPAPAGLLAEVSRHLQSLHPDADVPQPLGSAFMHWGADPREIGWTYWSAGVNSDEIMELALQPDPAVPIHVCGETFSRGQAWVEGAFETAERLADRLLVAGA